MDESIVDALRRAVEASPHDDALRLHLAECLLQLGRSEEALELTVTVLHESASNVQARSLMSKILAPDALDVSESDCAEGATGGPLVPSADHGGARFDWSAAEDDVVDLVQPMFVGGDREASSAGSDSPFDVGPSGVRLADVAGMEKVKERLNASFLAPLKNPELRALYAKSLRGGLLLYGPPGCGKTFLAKAIAGELGAQFISIGPADILDPMLGNSEQNVHAAFAMARQSAPCVLFFDEIDALGQRRSQTRNSVIRGTVNQLLTELDGVSGDNEGIYVLAATNQPWDVDPALRRPGRLDRTMLVLPPDRKARLAIFQSNLSSRPVEAINLDRLSRRTEGYSGADVAYVCELAAERALLDSVSSGNVRMIEMRDLEGALDETRPSTGLWLESARNVVLFGDDDGTYSELRSYLKSVKRI